MGYSSMTELGLGLFYDDLEPSQFPLIYDDFHKTVTQVNSMAGSEFL